VFFFFFFWEFENIYKKLMKDGNNFVEIIYTLQCCIS